MMTERCGRKGSNIHRWEGPSTLNRSSAMESEKGDGLGENVAVSDQLGHLVVVTRRLSRR